MRHGNKVNNLSRKEGHRRALMRNLANALIEHKRINTTLAKAKALRTYIEPLVTKGKSNTTHSRRVVFSYLQSKEAVKELFGSIAEKTVNRPGGYVRILRTGYRKGDGAEMAMIELVDFNELYKPGKDESAGTSKKRRTRRGGATQGAAAAKTPTPAAPVEAVVEEEAPEVVEEIEEVVEDISDEDTPAAEEEEKTEE